MMGNLGIILLEINTLVGTINTETTANNIKGLL